jgi:hypothetical protein
MKKLILLLLFIPLVSFGQDFNDPNIIMTKKVFIGDGAEDGRNIELYFIKSYDLFYIVLHFNYVPSIDKNFTGYKKKRFSNNLFIILDNEDVISITDQVIVPDDAGKGYFILNKEQIVKLKQENIKSIEYSIISENSEEIEYLVSNTIGISTTWHINNHLLYPKP